MGRESQHWKFVQVIRVGGLRGPVQDSGACVEDFVRCVCVSFSFGGNKKKRNHPRIMPALWFFELSKPVPFRSAQSAAFTRTSRAGGIPGTGRSSRQMIRSGTTLRTLLNDYRILDARGARGGSDVVARGRGKGRASVVWGGEGRSTVEHLRPFWGVLVIVSQ